MRRVILHIGRHKTGTTAIQRFLRKNRSLLEECGFCYPDYGIRGFGHHEIGAPITRGALSRVRHKADDIIAGVRKGLDAVVQQQKNPLVISSEAFQNCNPADVRKLFDGYDVEVIVYLREQVKYLLSAYAQKVQASNYSGTLEDFFLATSHSTYKDFLDDWEKHFPNRIRVKNYDRQELIKANVVVDFCQTFLGMDGDTVAARCQDTDANPSLTSDLLAFKLRVNHGEPLSAEHSRMLFNGLARLAVEDKSGSLRIPEALACRVARRYAESNRYIADRYFGRETLFRPFSCTAGSTMDASLDARMSRIREKLISGTPELAPYLPDSRVAEKR
ncbi:hypothetical protein ACUNV4_14610 [Granulosicoccus sp. 3-233]|uniref:hypothetical protein n=1 Tax=Granulosicoccus sp. 3-233 TaxID=3417969 RepID=UPI003D34C932